MNDDVKRVWIVDDDSSIRWVLGRALSKEAISIESFDSADDAITKFDLTDAPDVIVTDNRMPGTSGLEFLEQLKRDAPWLPVILMTAHTDLDSAVSAYQGGAFEYLPKPFDIDEAVSLVYKALEHARKRAHPTTAEVSTISPEIIGEAPSMQEVFRIIGRLSKSNMSVLIRGESGTGKELVARALYRTGSRRSGPFVAINTAAIPADLLESELFGHEKGAFTGAHNRRTGRFEQADGGTLFLDEIGDMPAELQTRLLRVLSDDSFYRVGGHQEVKVDVRIIAATNQDLETRVADGRFREDLYHRLNVISINIPPLRRRREDIVALSRQFLKQAAIELDVDEKQLSVEALSALVGYRWPGNVRQLENVCRRLTVMAPGQSIGINDLPEELTGTVESDDGEAWEVALRRTVDQQLSLGRNSVLDDLLPAFERVLLNAALEHTAGHKQEAARRLGWGRNTLTRKLKELDG
ncbi:MAG: sigma-54-dependent Fis family transcriptional regulator [marine bacterium B5-7]|nr:MAG: sigma-54-dependent Fis family transcriptional regulator [marine bacterium B5-7]